MKQVFLNQKDGTIQVEETHIPKVADNGVLVKTHYSLVSAGTESMVIEKAGKSLMERAKEQNNLTKKVMDKIKSDGLVSTVNKIINPEDRLNILGYSCSGIIVELGKNVNEFAVGDKVACAGGGYANHAEVNYIPRNLCVKIPLEVSLKDAAYTTLGSIAMQGVRQAAPRIGEVVVVIGLGLIGLLTIQILKANGCIVVATDIDKSKLDLAKQLGIQFVISNIDNIENFVNNLTDGFGADSTIITAATSSNQPMVLASQITRLKGNVVVVGAVGMNIPRNLYYIKELDLKLSMSYGPGRYDQRYEEKGVDYPYNYVRWTENRNMKAFLNLLASKYVDVAKLTTHTFKISDARIAYDLIKNRDENFVGIILEYPKEITKVNKHVFYRSRKTAIKSDLNVGFIGAGGYAKRFLLPLFSKHRNVRLIGVASERGLSAKEVALKYSFEFSTSDSSEITKNPSIDVIVVSTRHDSHARLVVESLRSRKNVFVEKPLALNYKELDSISKLYNQTDEKLFVGFNRRFSTSAAVAFQFFQNRTNPLNILYRVNAGNIPQSNWIQDRKVGGGRIIGEVCHFIDFMIFLTNSPPITVSAISIKPQTRAFQTNDNVLISLEFKDGSIGSIIYTAAGDPKLEKEYIEIYGDNRIFVIKDFSEYYGFRNSKIDIYKKFLQDKGQTKEVDLFIKSIVEGKESLISFDQLYYTTLTTFKIHESLEKKKIIAVE